MPGSPPLGPCPEGSRGGPGPPPGPLLDPPDSGLWTPPPTTHRRASLLGCFLGLSWAKIGPALAGCSIGRCLLRSEARNVASFFDCVRNSLFVVGRLVGDDLCTAHSGCDVVKKASGVPPLVYCYFGPWWRTCFPYYILCFIPPTSRFTFTSYN